MKGEVFLKKELIQKNKKQFPLDITRFDNSKVTSCKTIKLNTVEGAYKILICNIDDEERS